MELCRSQGLLGSPYEVGGDWSRVESGIDMVSSDSGHFRGCTWGTVRLREEQ